MISEFVREQKRYTQAELYKLFKRSEDEAILLIRRLKEFGVLKAVPASVLQQDMTELLDEDIVVADVENDGNEYFYVFTFVGIIVVAGCVLKCYPKYLLESIDLKNNLQQVLRVLEKYSSKEQVVRIFNESNEERTFNLLAVLLFFLLDYYENGVYSDTKELVETNGDGEILWDRTINETFMMLSDERPHYVELQTKKRIKDEHDYFKLLHECVLTQASRELKEADLLDIFGITEVELSDSDISDFGDNDYILDRIEKELNTQFNTWKQMLLKTLYAYIAHKKSLYDEESFSLFGTNFFNLVWEGICADVLDNQLKTSLASLQLPVSLKPGYGNKKSLIDLIEKPFWTAADMAADKSLRPDIITIAKTEQGLLFIILDAKYYNTFLKAGLPPQGQPGIESITKQYLYQLAYKKFIEDHEFNTVENCFLLPTEKSEVVDGGEVELKMLSDLGLKNIKVRFVPANMIYNHYLNGEKLKIELLKL